MIVLDTHIWVWWVHGDARLTQQQQVLQQNEQSGLGVSAISCWEVAKRNRVSCARAVLDILEQPAGIEAP